MDSGPGHITTILVTVALLSAAFAFIPGANAGSPGTFGEFVLAADDDVFGSLQDHATLTGSGGADGGLDTIKCIDADSDGTTCDVDPDDPIYIDIDEDGTLDPGDLRVTEGKDGSNSVESPGSRVSADDDDCCGTSYDTTITPTLKFVDNEPSPTDGVRQTEEAVYMDVSGAGGDTTIAQGDVPIAGGSEGDRVETGDNEVGDTIKDVAGTHTIKIWDADGDGSYSAADSVYLDMDDDDRITPGDIVLYSGDESGASGHGTVIDPSSSEVVSEFTSFGGTPEFAFHDSQTTDGAYTSGESLWLDIDGDEVLEAGDVTIISGDSASGSEGDQLDTNDDEVDSQPSPMEGIGTGALSFHDANGNNQFDAGDNLYINTDGDSEVDAGDIRLNEANSRSFGDISSSDGDVGNNLLTAGVDTTRFKYVDADGSGTYNGTLDSESESDRVYYDADNDGFLSPGDVVISSNAGSAGDVIQSGDSGIEFPCLTTGNFDWTAGTLYAWDEDGDGTVDLDDPIYLSRTADTTISVLDLRLSAASSDLAAGTQVRSGDFDQTSSSVVAVSGTWRFFDEDGDNRYDIEDSLFIDVDNSATISVGDVRVIDPDETAKGDRVTSSDADLSRSLSTLPNVRYCVADASGDGSYTLDDYIYLDVREVGGGSSPGTAPTVADVRISGSGGSSTVGGGSSGGGGGGGGGGGSSPPAEDGPSVSINNPDHDSYHRTGSSISISGTASGGDDDLSSVEVTVNGAARSVTGTSSWSASFTAGASKDYTIVATATDDEGETAQTSVTIHANLRGMAMKTCPDGSEVWEDETCPSDGGDGDSEAEQIAREAKETAEQAQDTAEQARDAAEDARDVGQENQDTLREILNRLNETDGQNGAPAPGLAVVLAALGLALVARRWRQA